MHVRIHRFYVEGDAVLPTLLLGFVICSSGNEDESTLALLLSCMVAFMMVVVALRSLSWLSMPSIRCRRRPTSSSPESACRVTAPVSSRARVVTSNRLTFIMSSVSFASILTCCKSTEPGESIGDSFANR